MKAPTSTALEAMTEVNRIELLSSLLLSEPWTLVVCGLGEIKGEILAKHLLKLSKLKTYPAGKTIDKN